MSAERAVLGCILLGDHQAEIFTGISADDFVSHDCKALFEEMHGFWRQHGRVDAGCISSGNRQLAVDCADFVPSLSGWATYLAAAKDEAVKVRAQELAYAIASGNLAVEDIREVANQLLQATQGREPVRRMGMKQAIAAFWEGQKRKPDYFKTGLSKLDHALQVERGDYLVLGARPSTGKTAFALKLARHIASQGVKTVFYSYETKIEKLMGRTVSAHCSVDMAYIKAHNIPKDATVEHLSEDLGDYPLEMVEAAGKGVGWLKADVLRTGAQVIFIDYIGLLPTQGDSRFEKVTNASLAIRDLCQTTGAVAFVLCQINRAGKGGPAMEDLKESGQIEQDADAVLLLHNPLEVRERNTVSNIELLIAKNKEGIVGKIDLYFDGSKQDFYEMEVSSTCA